MGRPPLPKAEHKSVRLSFRVTTGLQKAIVLAAKREGKTVGRYITDTLVNAVKGGK